MPRTQIDKQLLVCASEGDVDKAKSAIGQGANVNVRNWIGSTSLHYAASNGHLPLVQYLVGAGATMDTSNKMGHTPISMAIRNGQLEVAKFLQGKGAKLNTFEAVQMATLSNQPNVVHYVIEEITKDLVDSARREDVKRRPQSAVLNVKNSFGYTPLHYAAKSGDLAVVRYFLEAGAEVEESGEDGLTPLLVAIKQGHLDVVKFLRRQGATFNKSEAIELAAKEKQANILGYILQEELHHYVRTGDVEKTRLAVEQGANINAPDELGHTALQYAASRGHLTVVQYLVEVGSEKDGSTSLSLAINNGHLEVAKFLSGQGAKLTIFDAVRLATLSDKVDVIDFVAEEIKKNLGEDFAENGEIECSYVKVKNKYGYTALHYAAMTGRATAVQFFVSAGAPVNVSGGDGLTPLLVAVKFGHLEVVQFLRSTGATLHKTLALKLATEANIIHYVKKEGMNEQLLTAAGKGNIVEVQAALTAGTDINTVDFTGNTPLIKSALGGHLEIIKFLTSKLANVNRANFDGETPLSCTIKTKNRTLAEWLLENGAKYSVHTALLKAVTIEDLESVELLIKYGADVNSRYKNGSTALTEATETGNFKLVALLLSNKADPDASNAKGDTPMKISLEKKCDDITKALMESGAQIQPYSSYLVRFLTDSNFDMAKMFVGGGANINALGKCGHTPLTKCIELNRIDLVSYLLDNSAIVNLQNRLGITPLVASIKIKNSKIVEKLIEKGADVNLSDAKGTIPLEEALSNQYLDIARILIQSGATLDIQPSNLLQLIEEGDTEALKSLDNDGANLNIIGPYGQTPLTKAVRLQNLSVVQCLTDKGADVNRMDGNGHTSLSLALSSFNFAIVDCLINAGSDLDMVQEQLQQFANYDDNFRIYLESRKRLRNVTHQNCQHNEFEEATCE